MRPIASSSVLKPQFGNSYGPENLFEGPAEQLPGWKVRQGNGIGEWITIEFEGMRTVQFDRRAQRLPEEQRHLPEEQPRAPVAGGVLARRNPDADRCRIDIGSELLTLPKPVQGLLGQVHHRRRLGRQQIHRYRDHEAGGQFGEGAVNRKSGARSHGGWRLCGDLCGRACLASAAAQAQKLPGDFVYPARHRSDHPPGHPLRRLEQFRRPEAFGLRRRPNAW